MTSFKGLTSGGNHVGRSRELSSPTQCYDFVPKLASYLAESPLALDAVLKLSEQFDRSLLSPQEQQVVLLSVSVLNGCDYCKTVHTALGKMADISADRQKSIVASTPLQDARLEALRKFTLSAV